MPNFKYQICRYVCVSGWKKSYFFEKFGVLCFFDTSVLRFVLLAQYRRIGFLITIPETRTDLSKNIVSNMFKVNNEGTTLTSLYHSGVSAVNFQYIEMYLGLYETSLMELFLQKKVISAKRLHHRCSGISIDQIEYFLRACKIKHKMKVLHCP